jgi:DNA-binding NarL/FixJ family response regulator
MDIASSEVGLAEFDMRKREMSDLDQMLSFREEEMPPGRDAVRALVLDDDSVDVSIMRRLSLKSRQIELYLHACGSIADAQRALAKARFDILYVDYWLGEGTSIAFIHDVARRRQIPCILMTGSDTPEVRRVAFRAGVAGFLAKDELSIQAIESVTLTVLRGTGKMQ